MSLQVKLPPQAIIDLYQAVDPAALLTQVMGWHEPFYLKFGPYNESASTLRGVRVPKNQVTTYSDAVSLVKSLGFKTQKIKYYNGSSNIPNHWCVMVKP